MYVLASLDQEKLNRLQRFESNTGVRVLAFADVPAQAAPLDSEVLEDLQELEQELGVTLVAVK